MEIFCEYESSYILLIIYFQPPNLGLESNLAYYIKFTELLTTTIENKLLHRCISEYFPDI